MRVLLCFLFSLVAAAQAAKPPLSISIAADAPSVKIGPDRYAVKTGSEVFITVRITNTSPRNLSLGYDSDSRTGVGFGHIYEVRGPDGNLARKREIAHPELGSTGHGWPARVLKPGESMDIAGDHISRLFFLDQPGEYTIQLSRAFGDSRGSYVVKSNTIILQVTAPALQ
jgi:hypothetical protein